jgi:hypothetical protein
MIEALAWPFVGLVLGLVVIFVLYGPIVRKIDRINRAGRDGVFFDRPQEAAQPQGEVVAFDDLMKHPMSATALDREKFVSAQLASLQFKTDADRIALLQRVVAITNIEIEYTRIAHHIFGSQLNLLVRLAGTRQGLALAEAKELFDSAKGSFPTLHGDRPFDVWLEFLATSNLIAKQPDRIDITQYGLDFLKYLVDARLAYDRFG